MIIHSERFLSGMGFRFLLNAALTTEAFSISILWSAIRIVYAPIMSIARVAITQGRLRNEMSIIYYDTNNHLHTRYIFVNEPDRWIDAFRGLDVPVIITDER